MTRESIMLCEAAKYDVIIVETVGVGQSETAVRNMVDFFMLLALTGAGDDLQGMKKGIMEMTDLIVLIKLMVIMSSELDAQCVNIAEYFTPFNQCHLVGLQLQQPFHQ